jgi:uncharacterized protein (TIGR03083 family)
MSDVLTALRHSADRLRRVVGDLTPDQVTGPAYPSEWTVADTLSHLGSGAVIFRRSVLDALSGEAPPDGFNQSVWDEWNAKSPQDQARDVLTVDDAAVTAVTGISEDQRGVTIALGPWTLDFDAYVGLRLAEHVLHTWDVEVALDPAATVPGAEAAVAIASVPLIVPFAGKPTGTVRDIIVRTTDPDDTFVIGLTTDGVSFARGTGAEGSEPDLTLPLEALLRLVYGRLDPDHTPESVGDGEVLAELRRVFPGF